jgi:hypothetical protein
MGVQNSSGVQTHVSTLYMFLCCRLITVGKVSSQNRWDLTKEKVQVNPDVKHLCERV